MNCHSVDGSPTTGLSLRVKPLEQEIVLPTVSIRLALDELIESL